MRSCAALQLCGCTDELCGCKQSVMQTRKVMHMACMTGPLLPRTNALVPLQPAGSIQQQPAARHMTHLGRRQPIKTHMWLVSQDHTATNPTPQFQ